VQFDKQVADILAVLGTATGIVALIYAVVMTVQLAKMRHELAVVGQSSEQRISAEETERQVAVVRGLEAKIAKLQALVADARSEVGGGLRHVAVVHYDAFHDMAGRYSFSAALLDDNGDGLVISSITGRSEARLYVKQIAERSSTLPLSPEEQQAIEEAISTSTSVSQ
jgi:hypothetical protein